MIDCDKRPRIFYHMMNKKIFGDMDMDRKSAENFLRHQQRSTRISYRILYKKAFYSSLIPNNNTYLDSTDRLGLYLPADIRLPVNYWQWQML